ncbi:hypothetical protein [Variovorax sp. PBL-E5]|uniref:hypothetical protein n=1 Tax=Variovorax sp. PBL-E5 TaxID=434014 RepID=UPI0013A5A8C8|nr:hypothetical protein [Variovorax sp. PBL-E5]
MNLLQFELDRLYGLGASAADGAAPGAGDEGRQRGVRALVLELALPAGGRQISSVWQGVQSDLGLPAPAIAVSGVDGLQLWFSLASPISPRAGERFLQGLRARYLSDLGSAHVHLMADTAEFPAAPPVEISPDRWSAFVAPDLASVFSDTPWLDFPPNGEGQATLLRALEPMQQGAFEAALSQLGAIEGGESGAPAASTAPGPTEVRACEQTDADPVRFLRGVMNDETAPLALRIEAAKALLPGARRS